MAQLQLIVVTPERTVRDTPADFVAVPLFDGEAGIAPGKSPMIGRLGFGELRYTEGGQTHRFYVEGGFVQVVDDVVSVLTGRVELASELDVDTAVEALAAARARPANTPELMAIRDRGEQAARAQLHVARRASIEA